jgi:N-acetylglucosamine kinase-like BadF-type ATPase
VIVLAVDGGNSKTDLALVRDDGALLALVRGPMSSPHHLGVDGSLEILAALLGEAAAKAGLSVDNGPVAEVGSFLMAGVDFPKEEQQLHEVLSTRGWTKRTIVGNDTFAVLRAGTEAGWGVAVVCGSGINCVGVAPDGRHVRFPSLGEISGDWGGGYDVGMAAVSAAARSEDGRGPKTSLEREVPQYFGLETPHDLAEAFHQDRIAVRRVVELAPLLFESAQHDAVAAEIIDRLADEVVAFARAALLRLDLAEQPVEVLLGGGLLQRGNGRLAGAIEAGLKEVGSAITVRSTALPPVVGAALVGLDELGADRAAQTRLREEFTRTVKGVEGGES